jgi:hypothetical protein
MPFHDPSHIHALGLAALPLGEPVLKKIRPVAKALVAGASVAIAVSVALVADGLTAGEILTIAGSFLAGAAPTWVVPNKPAE